MNDEWEEGVKEIWLPEYDYILEEINELFEKEKEKLSEKEVSRTQKQRSRKNLELIRIYLPEKDFEFLEKYKPFKRLQNLGGIPVRKVKEERIRIDVEVVNPRKRKRKTIIYVREDS